jgi:hypothetical protein
MWEFARKMEASSKPEKISSLNYTLEENLEPSTKCPQVTKYVF